MPWWTWGSKLSNTTTSFITGLSANRYYRVIVTDANLCTSTDSITISEPDKVVTTPITGSQNVNESDIIIYGVTEKPSSFFKWSAEGGNILSGQGTNFINVQWGTAGTGQVSVIETDLNGCQGDTVSLKIQIGSTGLNDPINNGFKIYPNPAENMVIIEYPNPENKAFKLVLTDVTGKVIKLINNLIEEKIELDCNNLSKGIYLLELKGSNTYRGKIIIK